MYQNTKLGSNKIDELESIRGIAALLVVIHHVPNWNSLFFDLPIIRNGYLMVELFFVLSGFVIHNAYSKRINSIRELYKFQFLRFGRLYPTHLLFLIIFLFLECLKYYVEKKYAISSPNSVPFSVNNVSAFTAHIFLSQAIGVIKNVGSFNAPSWSISAEFYTYLLFGFVILYTSKWKTIIFFFLPIILYFSFQFPFFLRFSYLFVCIIGFSIGCLVSILSDSLKIKSLHPIFLYIILILLLKFLMIYPIGVYYPIIFILSALLIFTIINTRSCLIVKFLRLPLFIHLGRLSYSLYMSHFLVLWCINQFIRLILKVPETIINGESFPSLSISEAIIAYLLSIVFTLVITIIVYKYIENPFRNKTRETVARL